MSATWGSDGTIVVSHVGGLYRVPAAGGSLTLIRNAAPEGRPDASPATPDFLPDGHRFLYVSEGATREETQICVGSLELQEDRCILNVHSAGRFAAPGYVLFVRDAVLRAQRFDPQQLSLSGGELRVANAQIEADPVWRPLSYSASGTGVLAYHSGVGETQLVWLDRSGRRLGDVGPIGDYGSPELSPDASRMLVSLGNLQSGNRDLWLYDLSRRTSSRFTFDSSNETNSIFSPDGSHVVFFSDRTGRMGLYEKATNGTGSERLLVPTNGAPNSWSSDGRLILYQEFASKTAWDIWALPSSGDGKPFAVIQTEHSERVGQFSPDVRWIAYDSTESGERDVWVQPFPPTGSRWQVSTGGGFSPQWRDDGKELYYVAGDGRMMVVEVVTGDTPQFGTARALFQTMFREGAYGSYTVTRQGDRFLMQVPPAGSAQTPITVIVNWTAALRE
jgi:Tol biopolymer transport system component